MNKKNILITGSTGGIGSELTRQLIASDKYDLHLIVRSMERAKEFLCAPNISIEVCDLGNYDDIARYFQVKMESAIFFDYVLLLAGDLKYDSEFPGTTQEDQEKNSIEYHTRTNVRTAETVVAGLQKTYGKLLHETVLLGISSWAANFEVGHPFRKDEEGYVISKNLLTNFLKQLLGTFKSVFIEEPALIRSPLTERKFPHLLADPAISKLEPDEYVQHLRKLVDL